MPGPVFTVYRQAAGPINPSLWTTISNIQALELDAGRRKISDDWRAGEVRITGRRPDLLPSIVLGDNIIVKLDHNGYSLTWFYKVSDSQIIYGLTSSMDTWTITGEDLLASLGRATYTATWTTSRTVAVRAVEVAAAAGTTIAYIGSSSGSSLTQDTATFNSAPCSDVFQRLMNTDQAIVYANSTDINIALRGWQSNLSRVYLSDDGSGTNPGKYQDLEFRTLYDNYTNKVTAQNDTLSVTNGSGYISYTVDTLALTSSQLTDIAQYIRNSWTVQSQTPTRVALLLDAQTNQTGIRMMGTLTEVAIRFRGTTYLCFIEGYTISADTTSTRINYYLSDSTYFKYLVLNDATYGTLDYNKIGF